MKLWLENSSRAPSMRIGDLRVLGLAFALITRLPNASCKTLSMDTNIAVYARSRHTRAAASSSLASAECAAHS